jgi:hypothetical protein
VLFMYPSTMPTTSAASTPSRRATKRAESMEFPVET